MTRTQRLGLGQTGRGPQPNAGHIIRSEESVKRWRSALPILFHEGRDQIADDAVAHDTGSVLALEVMAESARCTRSST